MNGLVSRPPTMKASHPNFPEALFVAPLVFLWFSSIDRLFPTQEAVEEKSGSSVWRISTYILSIGFHHAELWLKSSRNLNQTREPINCLIYHFPEQIMGLMVKNAFGMHGEAQHMPGKYPEIYIFTRFRPGVWPDFWPGPIAKSAEGK